jgi:prepilin-type N-terminal cleavage/methylation domain-containing protein
MLRSVSRRRAFTLTEMMFVLVIFGLVAGATMQIIVRQQKFYASTTDLMAMRNSLRDIGEAIPSDLRGISSVGNDIYQMTDSSIKFRLATGVSVVCSIGVTRLTAVIPPTTLSSNSAITTWMTAPTTGDTAFVYNEGASAAVNDDSWQQVPVTAALAVGSCPTASGYTSNATEAAAAQTITFGTALAANVVTGSVIRFYRTAKYSLYQPTAGGAWYLGFQDCPGAVCSTVQPVAGPYLAYSASAASTGLRFVYRDSTGVVTATPAQVARIDIIAKAQTENPIRMPGRPEGYFSDSLVVTIAIRNRT